MTDVLARRMRGLGYGKKKQESPKATVQSKGEKKRQEDVVSASSSEEEVDEDDTDSGSGSEEEAEKSPKQKKCVDLDLKFDISDPTHHYSYNIEMQFQVNPKTLLNSNTPVGYTIPRVDAENLFLPDSKKHVDFSARSSSHKNVATDKAIPKTVSVNKVNNSTPFKVGIRAKNCEALNTVYFNSGSQKEKTNNMFMLVVEPGMSAILQPNTCVYDSGTMLQSNLAKAYGHLNPDKLRKDDVRLSKDTKKGSIRKNSPYAQVLNASHLINKDENGNPTYIVDGDWINLDQATITKLIFMFEKKLHGQLVYWNLLEMGFEAYVLPPAESWTDLTNTQFSAFKEAQKELFMKRMATIDIGLTIVVAFPSLKPKTQEANGSLEYLEKKVKKQAQKFSKDF